MSAPLATPPVTFTRCEPKGYHEVRLGPHLVGVISPREQVAEAERPSKDGAFYWRLTIDMDRPPRNVPARSLQAAKVALLHELAKFYSRVPYCEHLTVAVTKLSHEEAAAEREMG